jgi:hypothetical protein
MVHNLLDILVMVHGRGCCFRLSLWPVSLLCFYVYDMKVFLALYSFIFMDILFYVRLDLLIMPDCVRFSNPS